MLGSTHLVACQLPRMRPPASIAPIGQIALKLEKNPVGTSQRTGTPNTSCEAMSPETATANESKTTVCRVKRVRGFTVFER